MRPIPQHVYDRAELLCRVHDMTTVAALIGKHPAIVSRMKARGWQMKPYPKRPRPSDFAIQVHHMNHRELCRHYRAGNPTVTRWRRELGE